jgi:hypothetical protein
MKLDTFQNAVRGRDGEREVKTEEDRGLPEMHITMRICVTEM